MQEGNSPLRVFRRLFELIESFGQDDDNNCGVLRSYSEGALGFFNCRSQVDCAAKGEKRGGTGVLDHRRWKRPRAAVRQGVRPETSDTGLMGHKQPKQRGDGGDGAPDLP